MAKIPAKASTAEGAPAAPAVADFSHLKTLAERTTAEYPFFEYEGVLDPLPTLICKPATDNPAYVSKIRSHRAELNQKAERMHRKNKRLRAGDVMFELLSPVERDLFPGIVIVGWRGVLDTNHKPVEFSEDQCRAFLASITDGEWEALRLFCYEAKNFRVRDDESADSGETGKN